MVCLRFEPGAAEWQARSKPQSFLKHLLCRVDKPTHSHLIDRKKCGGRNRYWSLSHPIETSFNGQFRILAQRCFVLTTNCQSPRTNGLAIFLLACSSKILLFFQEILKTGICSLRTSTQPLYNLFRRHPPVSNIPSISSTSCNQKIDQPIGFTLGR